MPHLRFTRDKRGYEHTFLVRRPAKASDTSSILYWFRTPPDVRVGRRPLDDETARALEQAFPHVQFDWPRLRQAQAARAGEEEASAPSLRPETRQMSQRKLLRRNRGMRPMNRRATPGGSTEGGLPTPPDAGRPPPPPKAEGPEEAS